MALTCLRCDRRVRSAAAERQAPSDPSSLQVACRACFELDEGILGSQAAAADAWRADGWSLARDLNVHGTPVPEA